MQHSRVGQKLSDLTTLRVVIGILALLLIVPAFNIASSLYGNAPTINHGGLIMLYQVYAQVSHTFQMQLAVDSAKYIGKTNPS